MTPLLPPQASWGRQGPAGFLERRGAPAPPAPLAQQAARASLRTAPRVSSTPCSLRQTRAVSAPEGRTLGKQTLGEPGSGLGAGLWRVGQKGPWGADAGGPPTQLLAPAWPVPAPVPSSCPWGPDPPQVTLLSGRPVSPLGDRNTSPPKPPDLRPLGECWLSTCCVSCTVFVTGDTAVSETDPCA